MDIEELARDAYRWFEVAKREEGEPFDRLKDDAPEWLTDLVRTAHEALAEIGDDADE